MASQIRFTQLVKAAGKPHVATLWVADPAKDPNFKKAIDENRVLTVHHANVGTKTDTGEIGFIKGGAASYLIFPKALPMAEGTRVIGLKFDMLDEPEVKDPVKVTEAPKKTKIERVKTVAEVEPEKTAAEEKEQAPAEDEMKVEPAASKQQKRKSTAKVKETSKFKVTVEFAATATKQIEVEAKNATEAITKALKEAHKSPPEPHWTLDAKDVHRK